MAFVPDKPLAPFDPGGGAVQKRRDATLCFVQQNGERFVVKAYAPDHRPDLDGKAAVDRELTGIHGFEQADTAALRPVCGPVDELKLSVGEQTFRFAQVLVFPYHTAPTLEQVMRENPDALLELVEEAAQRMVARHTRAEDIHAIHSDGAPHNVFADWTWFDFSTPHKSPDPGAATQHELWRFICGTLAVAARASDLQVISAFARGYAQDEVLLSLANARRQEGGGLRMARHPLDWLRLKLGDKGRLTRPRASLALDAWAKQKR